MTHRDSRLDLYFDWCRARQRQPFPLHAQQLADYASDTGGSPGVGWIRVVLSEQIRQGFPTPARDQSAQHRGGPSTDGEMWLRAAAQCPRTTRQTRRWQEAVTGRRDAVVLVARWMGLTRQRITALTVADLGSVSYPGPDQPRYQGFAGAGPDGISCRCTHSNPLSACPAHVLADWTALLPGLQSGSRATAQQLVRAPTKAGATPQVPHDGPLLFAVDRHGWCEPARPLSRRAVTAICSVRISQASAPPDDPSTAVRPPHTELDDAELDSLFDHLDELADELGRRTAELLSEARRQASWVAAAWR